MEMKQHPLSSNNCRKRAEEYFDKEKCYEKYIQLYINKRDKRASPEYICYRTTRNT